MPNKLRKCTSCKERFPSEGMIKLPLGYVHSIDCATQYAQAKRDKQRERQIAKAKQIQRKENREAKERIKRRSEWYDDLQTAVNKYVRLRDHDKPCCTCGKTNDVKYDAGHFLSRGARQELSFELTNIHKQCSVNCNQHGAGMRKEYEDFIIREYGPDHLEWLKGPHPDLKEKFPHFDDIKAEIKRFRKLCRDMERELQS